MSEVFVVALSKSAWTGLLTIAPAVLIAVLLLWFVAAGKRRR